MKEQKRIQNKFQWVPMHLRNKLAPPRKADHRNPLYWIACDGGERYFVNNTTEILEKLIVDTGGFVSCDDEIATIDTGKGYYYTHILPMEAVKIEEYDDYYDLDYFLQLSLVVHSQLHGCFEIRTLGKKGGIGEAVLLWDSLEAGKNIVVFNLAMINSVQSLFH
jgi:hypothetical protein